jgi:hypothetical protein
MQLSRLEGSRVPSKLTNAYLQEGVPTYILGPPQASVALNRAALEQALKENIGCQDTRTFVKMNDLLEKAERAHIIDQAVRKMARSIGNEADSVLHENPTSLANAYDVLIQLRGVLQHLYAKDLKLFDSLARPTTSCRSACRKSARNLRAQRLSRASTVRMLEYVICSAATVSCLRRPLLRAPLSSGNLWCTVHCCQRLATIRPSSPESWV